MPVSKQGEYFHIKIHPSADFLDESFRTIKFGSSGIKAIIGKRPDSNDTEVITLLFPKAAFTVQEAKQWVKDHKKSLSAKVEAYLILEAAAEDGEEPETVVFAMEFTELAEGSQAMAMPKATPTKVYAVGRPFGFWPEVTNKNNDAFTVESVGESYQTLIGSPVVAEPDLNGHGDDRKTGQRRPDVVQAGTIVTASLEDDGIDVLTAFQRERLDQLNVVPEDLVDKYALSMEATFLKSRAQYIVGDKTYSFVEALERGIASPLGERDDRTRYNARIISPIEYPAVALLNKGRNADITAVFEKVSAAKEVPVIDAILWHEADFEAYEASEGAVLTTKQRKTLKKGDFAYVDENGEGHLPIHDAAHVKNALARLNQTKISTAAKRKAFKRILSAAKKFGVKVDKDSDIYKAYGAFTDLSYEAKRDLLSSDLYEKYGSKYGWILQTFDDSVIVSIDGKTYRMSYTIDEDGDIEFGEKKEVEIQYVSVKASVKGGAMDTITLTPAELQTKLDDAAKAAVEDFKAAQLQQLIDEAITKAKPDIEKAALEAHQNAENVFVTRMKELNEIHPVVDSDKADLEAKVRAADDAGFKDLVIERLKTTKAQAVEQARASAGNPPAPPSLRSGNEKPDNDPYVVRKA